MEDEHALRLRISQLQQNLVTEYVTLMSKKCSQRHALSEEEFQKLHEKCFMEVLNVFSEDQKADVVATQILKQQLHLKYLELKMENGQKPTVPAVAGGVAAGTASGIGVAAGGAVGTAAVASCFTLSAAIATGGLVLVGVVALGVGVGVGFGVQKLIRKSKNNKKANESKSPKTK